MKPISWELIFEKYPGKWVAFKEDHKTVVAVSKNAKEAYDNAKDSGIKVPFLFKVPKESLPFVGSFASVK